LTHRNAWASVRHLRGRKGWAMSDPSTFDQAVEQNHQALHEFPKGNHQPLADLYSQRDDVTLGNPFGPFARGFEQVVETMRRAASYYEDGEPTGFEEVGRYETPGLGYLVDVERYSAKLVGREDRAPIALRVTSIFRPEDGVWRLVHRHADPITTPRPADSIIQA
jgi:ketosteroid isomerase-like protein